jgi:hypothetical protein
MPWICVLYLFDVESLWFGMPWREFIWEDTSLRLATTDLRVKNSFVGECFDKFVSNEVLLCLSLFRVQLLGQLMPRLLLSLGATSSG